MIALKIDGQFVDLPPNAKISLKLNNPLFTDGDFIPGDYSLPFELASPEMSALNAAIFGNNDVVESTDSFKKKPAELYYDGVLYRKGEIICRKVDQRLQLNFRFGLATISQDFKTLKLRDLMDETITISTASVVKKVFIKLGAAATSPYSIKVNDRVYSGATLSDLVAAINADVTVPRAQATLVSSGTTPKGLTAPFIEIKNLASPNDPFAPLSVKEDAPNGTSSPIWLWIVEAELSGYYGDFDTFFSSYKTNSPATNKFRIPAGYNEFNRIFHNQLLPDNSLQPNKPTIDGQNESFQFISEDINNLQPLVMLRYVFEKAATHLGIGYEGDWVGDTLYNSLLIHNTKPLGFFQDFVGESPFLFWARTFNLKDLVPDITFVDFLKALQSRYNLKVDWNDKSNKIAIKKRKLIAESTLKIDISNQAGVVAFVEDQSVTGVRLEADQIDKTTASDYYNVGEPELTMPVKCNELTQPIRYIYNAEDSAKFPLRLVTYGGVVSGWSIATVVGPGTASGRTMNIIYEDEWKRFLQQRINRKVIEAPLFWNMAELMAVDFDAKYRYDRNDYHIAWLDVELMMTRVNIKATFYKA